MAKLSGAPVSSGLAPCKRQVKRRAAGLVGRRRETDFLIGALRSVGQLAPRPDTTRQCAFDLRLRVLKSVRSGSFAVEKLSPARIMTEASVGTQGQG
jgi:hypothetical protein